MRKSLPRRDQLLLRVGAAKKDAGRAFGFIELHVPQEGEEVTRETFRFQVNKDKLKKAELRDGYYLLRSNLVAEDPAVLWERYVQLTQIEAAFQSLKSELGIRPIYPQLGHRVEAHILLAFLAYCLLVTLKVRLQGLAPGLTPRAVWEKLAAIQMLDVWLPTTDGRWLVMPSLHAAGAGAGDSAAQIATVPAGTTATTHQGQIQRISQRSTQFVVPTF
jgi:hypothetical protein